MSVRDPKRVSDGFLQLSAGVDQGRAPNIIGVNQVAFAINTTFRGGWPLPRPGLKKCPLTFASEEEETAFKTSLFQTAAPYREGNLASGISMQGGRIFQTHISDFSVQDISIKWEPDPVGNPGVFETDYNPANRQTAWAIQAENYWILQDGQSKPFIYNGASARRATEIEIPVGNQMVYYMGRIGVAKGREYVFGDIVYGPSGSPSLNYRDSILKFTENTFLAEGGAFAVPMDAGEIVGLKPIANLNTALGQGPLVVFTDSGVFATVLPQDRFTWKTTTQPLQTMIQLETGGIAQDLLVNVNEDLYYRTDDGIQSLAYAVRNSGQPGNTPISNEVRDILAADAGAFLPFGSGVNFDDRMLMTVSPALSRGHGVYHRGLVVLDFDLVTGMQSKMPPAWEGMWTGLNFLKLFRVRHDKVKRCFAYVLNADNEIELWEITKDAKFDNNGTDDSRISWSFDSRSMDFGSKFDSNQLFAGDMFIDQVNGQVDIDLDYRPDGYPCWIDWDNWSECAKVSMCADDFTGACVTLPNYQAQYRPYHQMVQPADSFDPITKKLHRIGYEMQFRMNMVGYCRVKQGRFNAYQVEQKPFGSQL